MTFVDIPIKLFRHNTDDPVCASLITRPTRQIAETENLDSNMNLSDWTKVGKRGKYSRSKKHFEAAIDFPSEKIVRVSSTEVVKMVGLSGVERKASTE